MLLKRSWVCLGVITACLITGESSALQDSAKVGNWTDNAYMQGKVSPPDQLPSGNDYLDPKANKGDTGRGNFRTSEVPSSALKDAQNVKGKHAYTGGNAGGSGSYDMVTDLKSCSKKKHSVNSKVGPMSEEVSIIFRGPMEISDIAVFDGSSRGSWDKVSSYSGGSSNNLVFMENRNYGTAERSPQTVRSGFNGKLEDASDPSNKYAGVGIATGDEVNIMQDAKCAGSCLGWHDEHGYHGWDGGKKLFATRVKMPKSGRKPDLPAIWMLNAQAVRSSQYQCNCRGMGDPGGCGELDIAEAIPNVEKLITHYYFLNKNPSPGNENFLSRPTEEYINILTLIHDHDPGTIKIVGLHGDGFNYDANSISENEISVLLDL